MLEPLIKAMNFWSELISCLTAQIYLLLNLLLTHTLNLPRSHNGNYRISLHRCSKTHACSDRSYGRILRSSPPKIYKRDIAWTWPIWLDAWTFCHPRPIQIALPASPCFIGKSIPYELTVYILGNISYDKMDT